MKKKLSLDSLEVKSFVTKPEGSIQTIKGGETFACSEEPEFCNFTYNRWCYSGGQCDTYEPLCTQPK
ncbi:pinensin family lanthipeptide [Roseivirga sp. BDSF3-8]|uniref:pinensin family lanthipeptide n=1 Tax=Roseivirga sp. BDSF3-8 TaxID=3241598 RepID=UPI0035326331